MTLCKEISPEWDGILRPGERILWQGAAQSGEPYRQASPAQLIAGFAIIVIYALYSFRFADIAENRGEALILHAISGTVIAVFLIHIFGKPMLDAYKVRRRFYTLTSRRAFIGSTPFGRRTLEEWPVNRAMAIEREDGLLRHVHFAGGSFRTRWDKDIEKIGFRNIPDAAHVHSLMLQVQEGTA